MNLSVTNVWGLGVISFHCPSKKRLIPTGTKLIIQMVLGFITLQLELNMNLPFEVLRNAQTSNMASGGRFLLE